MNPPNVMYGLRRPPRGVFDWTTERPSVSLARTLLAQGEEVHALIAGCCTLKPYLDVGRGSCINTGCTSILPSLENSTMIYNVESLVS